VASCRATDGGTAARSDDAPGQGLRNQVLDAVPAVPAEGGKHPLMQKIRYLDKLVDELAKGKVLEKILRQ
jgi:hypothetical protein